MTQTRLDQLMEKAANKTIELSEVAEICGAFLESNSRHSKDIKSKMKVIEEKLAYIEEKLDEILTNQSPAFGVIVEDDDEEEDQSELED